MRIITLLVVTSLLIQFTAHGQMRREDIYTDYVFYNKRQRLEKDLRENTVGKTFSQPINEDNEHRFESACWAITQFQFRNETVENGFRKMFLYYDSLQYDTKRALLEAVYAVYPTEFASDIQKVIEKESQPKLFAMCAVYLFRKNNTVDNANNLKIKMVEQFPAYDSNDLLLELEKYLSYQEQFRKKATPSLQDLFKYQQQKGNKIIYSFQRWNRDYPGMAIVQNADGSFVSRSDGHIMIFEQLARSGSSLPYFLTNGNSPQGIYSILGTAVANNNFIGPTPNIQMIMPYEDSLKKFFHNDWDSSIVPMTAYQQLLPPSWRNYQPLTESFFAGKIGRSEIIAHGTTIDPEYFKDKPYYPISPTLGCLCAKEIWNVTSGRLLVSEQFNLYSAFTSTPGNKGYLIVINIDDQQKAVSREEVEAIVRRK
ncbi:MAG: hypothetical protein IPP79_08550 [Chitinophagaceae bacterium]|nr:hypothetical protein [Chitinophagaceae bacterium]